MRKYFIVILLLLASIAARAEIYLGARYGAGTSLIFFLPHEDESMMITPINTAVAFRYCNEKAQDYEKYMNFLVEFGYGQRGYKTMDDSISVKSHVLELPLIMQARVPIYKNFNGLLTGLVYGAYYLQSEKSYNIGAVKHSELITDDIHFGGFEYGVGGGLGFSLAFGRTDFAIDARYMASMSYLFKPKPELYESMPMQVIISFSIMHKFGK